MNYQRKIYNLSETSKNIKDYITLDNGKKLEVHTIEVEGKVKSKLQYLKDRAGNWLRSRLMIVNKDGSRKYINTGEIKNGGINA